jgi:hypothetical protein
VKVTAVHGDVDTDTHGNVSAFISVEGVDKNVLLRKKPPFPSVGDVLEGYQVVEKQAQSGNKYLKAEKPQQPNATFNRSNGGGKDFKADPVKQRAIAMESSIKASLEYARLQADRGKLPDEFDHQQLRGVAFFFYGLITEAMQEPS